MGDEALWHSQANVHNPMFDGKDRVWITAAVRPPANPDVFKQGSSHPSAKLFPLERSSRHLGMYDPKTEKYTHISTGFSFLWGQLVELSVSAEYALPKELSTGNHIGDFTLSNSKQEVSILFVQFGMGFNF